MKKMLLFFCLLNTSMFPQWELQTPKIPKSFVDVKASDSDHAWIQSNDGELYRTTNGGVSWELSYSNPGRKITSFFFVDSDHGWAAASPGSIFSLKTTDGGVSWIDINTPVSHLFFVNQTVGYGRAPQENSPLYKTADGGSNWDAITDTVGAVDVYFINDLTGFYSARKGRLFKTTDGGENWTELSQLQSPSAECPNTWIIRNIKFVSNSVGFYIKEFTGLTKDCIEICSDQLKQSKTTDGGITWFNIHNENDWSSYPINFIVDEFNWWSLGTGFLFKTTNAGETWITQSDYPGFRVSPPNAIYFVDKNNGYVVGNNGTIFKTNDSGENWKSINGAITNFFYGDFVDENNGWAVGERLISKTTNGGKDWVVSLDTVDLIFSAIRFVDKNIGYAGGSEFRGDSYLFKTTDGGGTWEIIKQFPNSTLYDLFIFSDSIMYASKGLALIKSTDGGNNWTELLSGKSIYSSFFLDSLTGWVTEWDFLNDIFTFSKTTNGGISWDEITTLQTNIRSLFFLDHNLGWAVDNEEIYHTSDGGETWVQQFDAIDNIYSFESVKFMDENNGWVAGADNRVFKTTDGGEHWQYDVVIPFNNFFNDIEIFNNHVWLFSFAGAIFHKEVQMLKPAELSSFTASATDAGIKLQWTTTAETNIKGFEIEKAFITGDPNTEEWNSIAFVPGKGTTSEVQLYTYEDSDNLSANVKYRLKNISNSGLFTFSDEVEPSNVTSVEQNKPLRYTLEQNYPNPFNPSTTIKYSVPENSFTILKVFDVLGKEVAVLVNEEKSPGQYQVNFNSANLASGIYYYSIDAGSYKEVKKMILIK